MTKILVLSAGAAKGLIEDLRTMFRTATGAEIDATFGPVGAIEQKFRAGDACDVLVLSARQIDELERGSHLLAGSGAALGVVRTGIAVRAGESLPDISSAAALSAALRAADAIYLPDPELSTAGVFFVGVLRKLGIHAEVAPRLKAYANGATAMHHLAQAGEARAIGCTQITEIKYSPGVALVGPLPAGHDLSTIYSAAVNRTSPHADPARRLIALLAGSQTRALRREAGFEPPNLP